MGRMPFSTSTMSATVPRGEPGRGLWSQAAVRSLYLSSSAAVAGSEASRQFGHPGAAP